MLCTYTHHSNADVPLRLFQARGDPSMDGLCDWRIRTDTLFKSHVVDFRLDVPAKDVTMDGRSIDYVVKKNGPSTLIEEQRTSSDVETTLLREFSERHMTVTLSVNGVTSRSYFNRARPMEK